MRRIFYCLSLSFCLFFLLHSSSFASDKWLNNSSYKAVSLNDVWGKVYSLEAYIDSISTDHFTMFRTFKHYSGGNHCYGIYVYSDESFTVTYHGEDVSSRRGSVTASKAGNYYVAYLVGYSVSLDMQYIGEPYIECDYSLNSVIDYFNKGNRVILPVPSIDDYEYSSDLGVLTGFETRSKIYALNDPLNLSNLRDIVFRTGWSNKTSSGLDLWRNSFDDLQIQSVVHVSSVGKDFFGNVVDTNSEYLSQDPFSVSTTTFQYSTSGLKLDFPNIFNFSDSVTTYTYSFEVYFRLLASKDGEYYRGDWVSVSPDWSGISGSDAQNGIKPTVSVSTGDYVAGDGFVSGSDGTITEITLGSGLTIDAADNDSYDHVTVPEVGTPDFSNVITSLTSVLTQISAIPNIIGIVFGFLPGWCLTLAASSFGLMIALCIYKLIRG